MKASRGVVGLRGTDEGRWAMARVGIGVDLGSSTLRTVRLKTIRNGLVVLDYGNFPVPSEDVNEDKRLKMMGRELRKRARKRGHLAVSLNSQSVIMRLASFPKMKKSEIESVLKWEWDKYVPIPRDEAILDYHVVDEPILGESEGIQVLLIAAKKSDVVELLRITRLGGLRVKTVDVDSLAAFRALDFLGYLDSGIGQAHTVIDLGLNSSRVSIFAKDVPVMTRGISTGGMDLTRHLAGQGYDLEEAESLKCYKGLSEDGKVRSVLLEALEDLFFEIGKSLEFFLLKNREYRTPNVYLVGGGSLLKGIHEELREYLDRQLVQRLSLDYGILVPQFKWGSNVRFAKGKRHRDMVSSDYLTAIGLALWKEADR